MSRRMGLLLTGVSLLGLSCSGQAVREERAGQVMLYVTTDAPLPAAPAHALDPNQPAPLFDRLRLAVYQPGANKPYVERDFEIDGEAVQMRQVSMGVLPPPGVSGYVARARLFRTVTVEGGEPPALSTIDVFAELPVVTPNEIASATIALHVDDLGRSQGALGDPVKTIPGLPDLSELGSWPRAARVPCSGQPGPEEACAPGGAFWLGNPHTGVHHVGGDASVSRLVSLRPFFVDRHEVTVAEFRASGLARLEAGSGVDPWLGHADAPAAAAALTPNDGQFFCTYSDAPLEGAASREDQPVNCISWSLADAYCKAQGKTLPSEAQYEYLAGGLRSDLFVWGGSENRCDGSLCCPDSVWGRGGFLSGQNGSNSECRARDDLGGPLPAGRGMLDRLLLGDREVVDLMGNVSEWTRDYWNRITEPCWAGRPLLDDPECATPGSADQSDKGDLRTVKGQSWADVILPAASRDSGAVPEPELGFRCVRAAP